MILPPCNQEVFQNGDNLLAADACECGSVAFEKWVKKIAKRSGQRVDWHYSGGVAHVLYIGDRIKIMRVINITPCPANIMRYFSEANPGLYRNGVTLAPPGAVVAFYNGGPGSTYIVEDKND